MKYFGFAYYFECFLGGICIGGAIVGAWRHRAIWLISLNTMLGVYWLFRANIKTLVQE